MVIREEEFPIFPLLDAKNELTRVGRAVNSNRQLNEDCLRQLKEDEKIDEQYQIVLSYLLRSRGRGEKSKHFKEDSKQNGMRRLKCVEKHVAEGEGVGFPVKKENPEDGRMLKHKCEGEDLDRKKKQKVDLEENSDDSGVQVLDQDACINNGNSNPFVSSKGFSKSIRQHNACDAFRKAVIDVLKQPYDKEEYKSHIQAIQAGNYFHYHPDLRKKLKKYQCNRRKRLAIVRGFLFWLQNLTQEGAFKPWKDRACLVVEPPDN